MAPDSGAGRPLRRSYKRIVDVEKEAIVLLIVNALEAIGDVYGIYGFSGYGRENVEFYTIKDLDEAFSETGQAAHRPHRPPARHAHGSRLYGTPHTKLDKQSTPARSYSS